MLDEKLLQEVWDDLENQNKVLFETGFEDLDSVLGIQDKKGAVITIGARPAMGKTTFMLTIMENILLKNKKCIYFSLEMSKEQLVKRFLFQRAEVSFIKSKLNNYVAKDWEKLANAMNNLSIWDLCVDDSLAADTKEIELAIKELNPDVVFIDYFQLLGGKPKQDRLTQIEENMKYCASCKNSINSCNCNIEEIKLSCEAEKQKINNNLIDIENVIKTANEEKNLLERELSIKRNDIKEIEIFLNNNLKPANELLKNSINSIIEKQNKIYKQEWNQTEIKRYQELKLECQNAIKSYKSSNFEQQISMDAYVKFTEYVADMLRKWKFITQTDFVEFNEKDMDIYINGEPRKNAGKGHRALTYSAFIISLLEFVDKHIGFVVIDSPLLNLKEIDENNPDIKPEIQNAFWKDLANIENNIQIIVIENKEPPKELQENINFIKFTKNANLGRRGFY